MPIIPNHEERRDNKIDVYIEKTPAQVYTFTLILLLLDAMVNIIKFSREVKQMRCAVN